MPPFAPMAPVGQLMNLTMPGFAAPWSTANVAPNVFQWNPTSATALQPIIVTPVAPAAPIARRAFPSNQFIRSPQFVAWQRLLKGHATTARVSFAPALLQLGRNGLTRFITTAPRAAAQKGTAIRTRATFRHALSQPNSLLSNTASHNDTSDVDAKRTPEHSDNLPDRDSQAPVQSSRVPDKAAPPPLAQHDSTQVDPEPTITVPLQSPLPTSAPDSVQAQQAGLLPLPQLSRDVPDEVDASSNALTGYDRQLGTILPKRPGLDRSRLFDFQVTKSLFKFQQQRSAVSRPMKPAAQAATVETTGITADDTKFRPSDLQRTSRAPESDASNMLRPVKATKELELAGLANIQAVLQQRPESRLALWLRQVLAAPPSQSPTVQKAAQQLLQMQTDLAKTPSVIQTLQNELARLDGELRVVPLPHNLPNMGEISREILLSAQGEANPYSQQQAPSEYDAAQSPLARQVRQAHQDAGYLDEATRQVRTLANAQEGKEYLHFLAHLARKNGMQLIAMINFVNGSIGFGPFLKLKDINGTIRSMDPQRWGKDSEVLLHPLMGRANLVINILDLIENNRISIEEVRDLLRLNTDADILERLEVEIEAARIYRQDEDWWQQIWSGQDAEALKPWFDDLLAQISSSIVDLKDVLRFVTDLETGTAANDNAVQLSA